MGIFDVNMPLIYGEGPKAFERLQYEIIRTTTDLSLLAHELSYGCNLPASSPRSFRGCRDFHFRMDFELEFQRSDRTELAVNNQGLKLQSATFWPMGCDTRQFGRHYSLVIACLAQNKATEVFVCFRRLGSKTFVRHPLCHAARMSTYSTFTRYESRHSDDNVTLLFGGGENIKSFWPLEPRIQLPDVETLRIREPFVYPSSVCNWEERTIGLSTKHGSNSFYTIMCLDRLWVRKPVIAIQCPTLTECRPVGYFLRERLPGRMNYPEFEILQHLSINNSFSGFQRTVNEKGRRSLRSVESDGTTIFLVISFSTDTSPLNYTTWQMRLEQITRQQHYLTKLKDFCLRTLPQSAERLEHEPERSFRKHQRSRYKA